MTTWTRVRRRARAGDDLRVGIIGAGYVGRGLAHLLGRLDGFRCAIVVNRSTERAVDALRFAGADEVAVVDTVVVAQRAIERRVPAVTSDPAIAIALDELDVLVEGTGSLDYGAGVILAALEAGRAVVSINAEVDATIGWLLHCAAAAHGGVYTICDGDQPGVLMRTIDRVQQMSFEPIVAVNCKRHLDVHQSSVESAAYAARDSTSLALTVSAGDGTKMNIEQAVVANLTGMPPACRGMRGIPTTLEHALHDVLAATDRERIVEYTLGGDFGAGVFVIGRAPDPEAVETALRFYKLGAGPEYLVFNPYTLVQFDMPQSIAEVALDRDPLWSPVGPPVADVVAVAKRDLQPGDALDGIGGDACYGQIDTVAGSAGFLPMAFTEHARVVRAVARDEPVPLDAVEIDDAAPIVRLRMQQDAALGGERLMRFTETEIAGVVIVELEPIADDRGWFARSYCRDEFLADGLDPTIVQCNVSVNHHAGTVRGMHYQVGVHAETKLVRCVRGAVHDVVVDLRPDSPTRLGHVAVELTGATHRALYIPTGCAHGFQTLVDDTEVEYNMGASYEREAGRGVRFDDPALAVRWPLPVTNVSEQDASWPDVEGRAGDLLS